MLRDRLKQIPGVRHIINLNVLFEDRWFDFSWGVDTSSNIAEQDRPGWRNDPTNFPYIPIRPKCARRALRSLKTDDPQRYTFVDLGSGKGRMLFIAAEYNFKRICGIELLPELHNQACRNLRSCRMESVRSGRVGCINANATEYDFPDDELVIFLYNPFGRQVMKRVMDNLNALLDRQFRDVFLILSDSVCADVADQNHHFALQTVGHGYRIYRSVP